MSKDQPAPAQGIHKAMVAILRQVDAIGKNRKCEQGAKFAYRGIDDVYNTVNPLLVEHGVYMASECLGRTREERKSANGNSTLAFTTLHMRYRFIAEDGSSVTTDAIGEGMDAGDKSANKAMAVAHKYAIIQAFCIPTEDIADPDAEAHRVPPKESRSQPEPDRSREPTRTAGPKADARQQGQARTSGNAKPKDTRSEAEKAAAAKVWAEEAARHVGEFNDGKELVAWMAKNDAAGKLAKTLAPQAHRLLCDAIARAQKTLEVA